MYIIYIYIYVYIYTSVNPKISILVSDDTESRQAELSGAEPSLEQFFQMVSSSSSFEGIVTQGAWAQTPS
jgi:hypothetical protein